MSPPDSRPDGMPPGVRLLDTQELAHDWTRLSKTRFELQTRDGRTLHTAREVYHLGDGAAVLLYNRAQGTVLLTRQFRLPVWLKDGGDGQLIETCAGLIDPADSPESCARRELEEEMGLRVAHLQPVFQAYMSPGSVSQRLHLFCAEYTPGSAAAQGGLAEEGEDIEVLEMPLQQALAMVYDGRIQDGKTIMLLLHAALRGLEGLIQRRTDVESLGSPLVKNCDLRIVSNQPDALSVPSDHPACPPSSCA